MYLGKVGGPTRTSLLFYCSFVVNCYVQKACHQHLVDGHVIGVAT